MKLRFLQKDFGTSDVDPYGSVLSNTLLVESELVGCKFSYVLTEHIRAYQYCHAVVKKC